MTFAVYDLSNGQILRSVTCPDSQKQYQYDPATNGIIEGELGDLSHYVQNGVAVKIPDSPGKTFHFNYLSKQWEDPRTLADFKTQQWGAIKNKRTEAEYSGFSWDTSVFDSDAVSQNRIQGAVQLASMSTDFSIVWTLQDNTTRLLSAGDMKSVGLALGMHVAYQFQKAQYLRALIDEAASKEDVLSVIW
jgi:hypothetical protein